MMKFLRFWFPVALYSGMIFYVSSLERVDIPLSGIQIDKFLHVAEYMPFGFLLARAIYNSSKGMTYQILLVLVIIGSFLYGLSDEIHQHFVEGRSADIFDLIADTLGGGLGGFCWTLLSKRREQNNYVKH